jgi:hypothetical protein
LSGVISKNEQEAWVVASWVFRHVARLVLPHLEATDKVAQELARAEVDDFLDINLLTLSAEDLGRFRIAIRAAYKDAERAGAQSFSSPEFYGSFMDRFNDLLEMIGVDSG